ncbi:MAG: hypothetical protein IJ769_12625 [Clostridia bacterium]|nr:hypothetical protein [Clostridia bacterium]
MFNSRRRRIAWLFALVLLMELAILCCASMHLSDHLCPGCARCAICATVRAGLKRAIAMPLLALAPLTFAILQRITLARRSFARRDSLFARHVRLND